MKLTLIQSGGFTGKSKIAEEELSVHSGTLQQFVEKIFTNQPLQPPVNTADQSRDKENFTLAYNGKRLPLAHLTKNDELEKLLEKMKANLKYQKT